MRRRGLGRGLASAAMLIALALAPACAARSPKAPKAPKDKYAGLTAQQVYDAGLKQSGRGHYTAARETLQKVLSRTDATSDLIAKVHLALADAYFYDGGILNLAEAQSRYTNYLTFYPNSDRADYVQYQLGLCYLKQAAKPDRDQDQTRKALSELTKVKSIYPKSEYIAPAEEKAAEARGLLAEHEFRVGRFYFKRKSWAGAIQRFRLVLDQYAGYAGTDELYLLLGQALLASNKPDEGRLYLEKLVAEFPKSRHARQARDVLAQRVQKTAEGGDPIGPAAHP